MVCMCALRKKIMYSTHVKAKDFYTLVLSFHHVYPKEQFQIIRLAGGAFARHLNFPTNQYLFFLLLLVFSERQKEKQRLIQCGWE